MQDLFDRLRRLQWLHRPHRFLRLAALGFVAAPLTFAGAAAHATLPAAAVLVGPVTDLTGRLAPDSLAYLADAIAHAEQDGGPRLRAVLLEGEAAAGDSLGAYAERMLAAQSPEARIDALLIVQPGSRRARIVASATAAPRLSALAARIIVRDSVAPFLRDDNPVDAIELGVRKIGAALRGTPVKGADRAASATAVAPAKAASGAGVALPRYARVVDLSGALAPADIEGLRAEIAALEAQAGAQVVVLIVAHAEPETIEALAQRVFDTWKPGRKGIDDGVLMLATHDDGHMRIEVGYGLEATLTDATTGRIVRDEIVPLFKRGDFGGGLAAGLEQVSRVVVEAQLAPPVVRRFRSGIPEPWALIVVGCIVLVATLARFKLPALAASAAAAAGAGAVLRWSETGFGTSVFLAGVAAILVWMIPGALLGEGRSSSGGFAGGGGSSGSGGGGGGTGGGGGASGG